MVLLKFIVRLPWGVKEVTAAELRFIPGNEERVGRELFGYNANTQQIYCHRWSH